YIALSHCWGGHQTYKTDKASLANRKISMPWADIPKTFLDAIRLTRALGFSFLWIDSLCIVQDDPDDWALESSRMAHIYANSVLTIAAAAANNDAVGLFHNRRFHRIHIHRDYARPGPLAKRGWVFQERLLSRRILYYEEHEMVWECRTEQHCECGSDLKLANYRPSLRSNIPIEPRFQDPSPLNTYNFTHPSKTAAEAYAWWRKSVVRQYSVLDLTLETDRLPALSGLATTIRSMTRDQYLAGLWVSDLSQGLLWTPFHRAENTYRPSKSLVPSKYLAPSWSWASLNTDIVYGRFNMTEWLIKLLDYRIDIPTKDPTGAVSGGYIQVR
ncbi:HET-domain-containing protein, partial [Lojkania enalia]